MRCLEKPVLRARTGCEISALHGNWSTVQPGFEGDVVWQLHRPWKCAWMARVKGAGWRFFWCVFAKRSVWKIRRSRDFCGYVLSMAVSAIKRSRQLGKKERATWCDHGLKVTAKRIMCGITLKGRSMAISNPLQFIQQVRSEVSKVVWPTRREVLLTTVMVFVMAALAAVIFALVDLGIRSGLQTLLDALR